MEDSTALHSPSFLANNFAVAFLERDVWASEFWLSDPVACTQGTDGYDATDQTARVLPLPSDPNKHIVFVPFVRILECKDEDGEEQERTISYGLHVASSGSEEESLSTYQTIEKAVAAYKPSRGARCEVYKDVRGVHSIAQHWSKFVGNVVDEVKSTLSVELQSSLALKEAEFYETNMVQSTISILANATRQSRSQFIGLLCASHQSKHPHLRDPFNKDMMYAIFDRVCFTRSKYDIEPSMSSYCPCILGGTDQLKSKLIARLNAPLLAKQCSGLVSQPISENDVESVSDALRTISFHSNCLLERFRQRNKAQIE